MVIIDIIGRKNYFVSDSWAPISEKKIQKILILLRKLDGDVLIIMSKAIWQLSEKMAHWGNLNKFACRTGEYCKKQGCQVEEYVATGTIKPWYVTCSVGFGHQPHFC